MEGEIDELVRSVRFDLHQSGAPVSLLSLDLGTRLIYTFSHPYPFNAIG